MTDADSYNESHGARRTGWDGGARETWACDLTGAYFESYVGVVWHRGAPVCLCGAVESGNRRHLMRRLERGEALPADPREQVPDLEAPPAPGEQLRLLGGDK